MDTGIGLPNAVPDTPGPAITEWARRAEQSGFSTLGTPDMFAQASAAVDQAWQEATDQVGLLAEVLHG